jgi:sec-independent protein translocase protein TatA
VRYHETGWANRALSQEASYKQMGPLGYQEIVVIFVLALLLFGPKKLPELGRTLGKAMTEFRRASSELKATFDREMASIERENQDLKEVAHKYTSEISSYQYDSYYDSGHYGQESITTTANDSSSVGASATQGAESTSGTVQPASETVARNNGHPHHEAGAESTKVEGHGASPDSETVKS